MWCREMDKINIKYLNSDCMSEYPLTSFRSSILLTLAKKANVI